MFSDYGMPVVLYNDHYEMLLNQDFLFARKISPDALELRERLGALYASEGVAFEISNEGRTLYKFLTQGGRIGQRFAPRFWETEASLGRERELLVITCKKMACGQAAGGTDPQQHGLARSGLPVPRRRLPPAGSGRAQNARC